ncbi:glycoside hydrolase family 28 protein [Robinsoniella peoriensis]|uniref:glycoside hydrolase family 28 protein n=1 Tax=Robinsoniella peoriensis TaxID=180332 RepID=UPI00085C781D|nr:glycosyl hydrolase family 28 protein [Robinsoniella peoriensis]
MIFRLDDYGVQQNTVQTKEIQQILDEASEKGGMTVVIPRGLYLTGTLNLRTASLYLEKGAILKGSHDWSDYHANGFRHNEMRECISLLYSMEASDVKISGEGTIDLSSEAFYDSTRPCIPEDGHEYSDVQKEECPRYHEYRPTQPIFFHHCSHISVEGIRIINAPCWTMSFNQCEDIRITDLTICNDPVIPNNDGMHFCGCRDVIVRGCNIEAGDDCIALSGITDWDIPCENITVSDCVMTSCSKAISIGYMHSIVRNVTITNCVITESQRGIAIMSCRGTGLVEHVMINNLRIDTRIHAGNWWGNGEPICLVGCYHNYDAYLDKTPDRDQKINIRDIHFQNISCSGENVIAFIGENDNIQNIYVDQLTFEHKKSANRYLKGDRCIDVSPSEKKVTVPENCGYIYMEGCRNVCLNQVDEKCSM